MSCIILFWNWWTHCVPRNEYTNTQVFRKFFAIYSILLVTSATTYGIIFKIHLDTLTKAGPHDSVMTSAFQASLKVNIIFV